MDTLPIAFIIHFFFAVARKHPIEDDANLDIAEKRHSRVKSWTKKVDIFEKDFLIIPINERAHWFLAIVCFAGLSGPVTMKDNRPVDIPNQQQTYPKKACRKPFNKLPHVATGESFMIGKIFIFKLFFFNSRVSLTIFICLLR